VGFSPEKPTRFLLEISRQRILSSYSRITGAKSKFSGWYIQCTITNVVSLQSIALCSEQSPMAKTESKRDEVLRNMLKTPPKRHESLGVRKAHKSKDKVSCEAKPDHSTEEKSSRRTIFI
jgi:hypothetical protein